MLVDMTVAAIIFSFPIHDILVSAQSDGKPAIVSGKLIVSVKCVSSVIDKIANSDCGEAYFAPIGNVVKFVPVPTTFGDPAVKATVPGLSTTPVY